MTKYHNPPQAPRKPRRVVKNSLCDMMANICIKVKPQKSKLISNINATPVDTSVYTPKPVRRKLF